MSVPKLRNDQRSLSGSGYRYSVINTNTDWLPSVEFAHLQEVLASTGIHFHPGTATERKLTEFRKTYEPFVSALADRLLVSLPPWIPPAGSLDDWQTTA